MGENIRITAADGHAFDGWLARPAGTPRAGLLVLQESFGLNHHMLRITEWLAAEGYLALAPALFDRVRSNAVFGYDELQAGRDLVSSLDRAQTECDMRAAIAWLRVAGKVGAIGYCWGGALADLAACRCAVDAAVSYYGRHTATWLDLEPRCPVLYHFGGRDPWIPAETVAAIRAGRPAGVFHIYEQAGHGFNCDERDEFHAQSARLALQRTREFLQRHLCE